jgi:hypothetical protein
MLSVFVDHWLDLFLLHLDELVAGNFVSLWLYHNFIANSKLTLDVLWSIKGQKLPFGHDANSIRQLICLLEVLRAHYD